MVDVVVVLDAVVVVVVLEVTVVVVVVELVAVVVVVVELVAVVVVLQYDPQSNGQLSVTESIMPHHCIRDVHSGGSF